MKSLHLSFALLLFLCSSIKAEEQIYERVYVHTDKDCYIAGEDILLKFYLTDNRFQASGLSKVGYVEICDTEKPLMQLKLALEKKGGAGKIKIPMDVPTGIYQLSGYTRYMRNEGENVFFKKQIAVVNAGQQIPNPKRFEIVTPQPPEGGVVETWHAASLQKSPGETTFGVSQTTFGVSQLGVKTDQNEYRNRQKVFLSINNIPDNISDLVISVSRNDSIAFVPEVNKSAWSKQLSETSRFSQEWLPEYEGHIITGRFVPEPQEELLPCIAFVGKDIRYFNGQLNPKNGTVNFYTSGIFGKQQIVTSAVSPVYYDKMPYRLDLLTPFCESLPDNLPVLQIYPNEKQLLERYIGVQIREKQNNDFINNQTQTADYCTFQPVLSYNLDEYTRFATISETILEFISRVRVIKMRDKQRISVFLTETKRLSPKTLVLLDGVPIHDHEDILGYNPAHIKRINIYEERYVFGGKDFECIVSFITKDGNLPFFQLGGESQLFNYDCPQLPLSLIDTPDYSTHAAGNSEQPDFRHTLYWDPFVECTNNQPVNLSFYTSDLRGAFKVTVESITNDGKIIQGVSYFQVR